MLCFSVAIQQDLQNDIVFRFSSSFVFFIPTSFAPINNNFFQCKVRRLCCSWHVHVHVTAGLALQSNLVDRDFWQEDHSLFHNLHGYITIISFFLMIRLKMQVHHSSFCTFWKLFDRQASISEALQNHYSPQLMMVWTGFGMSTKKGNRRR